MVRLAGGLVALIAVAWSLDLQTKLGTLVYNEQIVALITGLALLGLYWRVPPILGRRWLNHVLGILALNVMLWIGWRFPVLQADMLGHPKEAVTLSVLALFLIVDACKRCSGWSMPLIFGGFFVYALLGHLIPGLFQTKEVAT